MALGGKREGSVSQGDFGKGFVHVFDERSLDIVLGELDTITDFVQYLTDKEAFAGRPTGIVGADEDVLALYLGENRTFPGHCDLLIADDTCWAGFSQQAEYLAKKEADQPSCAWDRIIELLSQEFREGYLQPGVTLGDLEQVVRVMASERTPRPTSRWRSCTFTNPSGPRKMRPGPPRPSAGLVISPAPS